MREGVLGSNVDETDVVSLSCSTSWDKGVELNFDLEQPAYVQAMPDSGNALSLDTDTQTQMCEQNLSHVLSFLTLPPAHLRSPFPALARLVVSVCDYCAVPLFLCT